MAEETVVQTEPVIESKDAPSPFANQAWTETVPEVKLVESTAQVAETVEQPTVEVKPSINQDEEILDPKDWLKREFEVDDVAVIKAEREELKKLKAQAPAEIKFENEQSKQIFELIKEGKSKEVKKFLETQERLEQFTTADVTKDVAADIIKMGLQLKHPDLLPSEIDYKFNKEYGIPKEPVQRMDELDEEFDDRKKDWQEKVADIEMARLIDAKMMKPELEKAKTQLILPELSKPSNQQANELDSEALQKIRENFLTKLESDYSKTEGFTTRVKDESVDIPVSFKIPDEDKIAIKQRLQEGLDINDYMDKRWFDEGGSPKVQQIISDLYQLENLDKVLSGVANNSASQRLKEHLKKSSNISLNGGSSQQTFDQSKSGSPVSPFAKDAWSEKPPVLTT
jgi:hypothetical protein